MQIAILGCGWLGLPLGEKLTEKYTVKGSVTSVEKLQLLAGAGIRPYRVNLNEPDEVTIVGFLSGSDVLVIAIPPKAKENIGLTYPEKIRILLPHIVESGIKKVLFTSSVSVYGEDETIPNVDEATVPNPQTESGKQVLAAEQVLQNCPAFKTTIVRFGGLIGGERHPVKFLAGRQNITNPDAPVNLIKRNQCLDIISLIIEKDIWNEVFTAASPQSQNRRDYYTREAEKLGLPLPHFTEHGTSAGKKVLGQQKISERLGYTL